MFRIAAGCSRRASRRTPDIYARSRATPTAFVVSGLVPGVCASILTSNPGMQARHEESMKARVTVTLKSGILDPQGKAIEGALKSLGIAGVASVRQGKVFDIEIEGGDPAKAEAALKEAADKLLANTVIENYRVEVVG
jgi:phosphoribosylformylglycinamidine synthase PurS subunit